MQQERARDALGDSEAFRRHSGYPLCLSIRERYVTRFGKRIDAMRLSDFAAAVDPWQTNALMSCMT